MYVYIYIIIYIYNYIYILLYICNYIYNYIYIYVLPIDSPSSGFPMRETKDSSHIQGYPLVI